jgi:hypothetical protein
MSLFPFSHLLPYMFRAFISPSSGGISSCRLYATVWYMRVFVDHLRAPTDWFVLVSSVKTPPQTSPQAHADDQQKHA